MISHPGLVFSPDYPYDPRWYYGQSGDIKIVSLLAGETLLPGTLVEVRAGALHPVSSGYPLAGIVVYDPHHYDASVQYEAKDMVPVMRRGSVFVAFVTLLPPFSEPLPLDTARYYPGGVFTTDLAGAPLYLGCFSVATRDYYANTDGSPAADIPYPVPPLPPGISDTTFGSGVALVDINLG